MQLATDLRHRGFWVELDARGGSLKSQMKRADKSGARYALVLGERELLEQTAALKPLAGGEPIPVPLTGLAAALTKT